MLLCLFVFSVEKDIVGMHKYARADFARLGFWILVIFYQSMESMWRGGPNRMVTAESDTTSL